MTAKLIGLVGYKGAGKSSVTAIAILDPRKSLKALPIYLMNFSEPIYRMLEQLVSPEIVRNKKLWDDPRPELDGKTLRHAAQTLGTEWGRNCISDQLWTTIALRDAAAVRQQGINVIIDNVRFPSEFDDMRKRGAVMIAFHRPGLVVDLSHSSEQHIAKLQRDCDLMFENTADFNSSATDWRNLLTEIIE